MDSYLNKIRKFHGHIGPYVVLGYIMGIYAKGYLDHIEKVVVTTKKSPSPSCILDGLQLSTGCTLGKNQIRLVANKKFRKAIFYGNRRKITVTLKPKLSNKLEESTKSALYFIKNSSPSGLFDLKK